MSIENKIYIILTAYNALTTLVDDRIFPDHFPQGSAKPAVCYNRVSGHRENTLQGYCGLENPRISMQVTATAVDQRREVGDEVTAAMIASTSFSALLIISPVDDYDDNIHIYRRTLDFSIWNKE